MSNYITGNVGPANRMRQITLEEVTEESDNWNIVKPVDTFFKEKVLRTAV